MSYTVGIDVGAVYTKAVLVDEARTVRGRALVKTGFNLPGASSAALAQLLHESQVVRGEIEYVASTGYGRYMVPFRDVQITELTCHAKGAFEAFPETRTVLDAGGQTVKAIKVDERGKVRAFRLNDKCAAGTGAFLEKTARYMGFDPADIGELAMKSEAPATISSICAVFAESEVINHLTSGTKPEDIMYGAVFSLARRSVQLMRRVGLEPSFTFVGGMTRNEAFIKALEFELNAKLNIPGDEAGHFNGALGAGLLALERLTKLKATGEWTQVLAARQLAVSA
jgi:(R)-2-hydroxyacyl-CoA dehydratese activating ATPase